VPGLRRRRERGALAIILHTHMPYVEGFGTWPFGEEWLWEAVVGSYVPVLELLDRGAELTLSLTPVLCDQLEAPLVAERFRAFVRDVRGRTHAEDAAGLRAAGHDQLAGELERAYGDYERALESLQARGGDLLTGFAAHAQWTSSATHAVLALLATDAGARMQVDSGVATHRARFGEAWAGGFWLPECAYAPWLAPILRQAGARRTCVELTARFGAGAGEHLRPWLSDAGLVLVPIDRATIELVWSDAGYPASGAYRDYHHHTVHHHNPWSNDGGAYDHDAALVLARRHAADFVTRTRARLDGGAGAREGMAPGGPLVVCALDTELLGHWWYEGVAWLEAVLDECARQGLALVRIDEAPQLADPKPLGEQADEEATSWGTAGDLSTWSSPAVADMAFAARAAELALIGAGGRAGAVAARELMALQASDWAFMVSRGLAVPYARERFEGHRARFERALEGDHQAGLEGLRNLAIHARPRSLRAP